MANKTYFFTFGSGNPSTLTGLSPTFTVFRTTAGVTTPPSISELSTTGIYTFGYDLSGVTVPIAFVIDGATTGLQTNTRYVVNALDPLQVIDQRLGLASDAIGSTTMFGFIKNVNTSSSAVISAVGSLSDSFGSTLTDPTSVFGYLKRAQEFMEGDSVITKTSGQWQIWSRGNTYVLGATTYAGSSTMLTLKTVSDNGTTVNKV